MSVWEILLHNYKTRDFVIRLTLLCKNTFNIVKQFEIEYPTCSKNVTCMLEPLLHHCRNPHFIRTLKLLCKTIYKFIKQFEIEYPIRQNLNISSEMNIMDVKMRLMESLEHNCKSCITKLQNIDKNRNKELIPELTLFAIKNNLNNILLIDSYEDNKMSNNCIIECVTYAIKHNTKDAIKWIDYIFNMYKINDVIILALATHHLSINSVTYYMGCNTKLNILCLQSFTVLFPYFCKYKMEKFIMANYHNCTNDNYLELGTLISKDICKWTIGFTEHVFDKCLNTKNFNFKLRQSIFNYAINRKGRTLIRTILNTLDLYHDEIDLLFPLMEHFNDIQCIKYIENNKNTATLFNIKAINMDYGTLYLKSLTEDEILQIMINTTNPKVIQKCKMQLISVLSLSPNKIVDETFAKTFLNYAHILDEECANKIINEYILHIMK